jgi:hypothetical protein
MGQAKLRGDFETRQAEGIARRAREKAARDESERLRWERLTPAQRKRELEARKLVAMWMALANSAT